MFKPSSDIKPGDVLLLPYGPATVTKTIHFGNGEVELHSRGDFNPGAIHHAHRTNLVHVLNDAEEV
jgi:hypothetical protein